MPTPPDPTPSDPIARAAPQSVLPAPVAADLQDELTTAAIDLERVRQLLANAGDVLIGHFSGAAAEMKGLLQVAGRYPEIDTGRLHAAMDHLAGAIAALQVQDTATQVLDDTGRRLRHCADRLALEDMSGGRIGGGTVVGAAPGRTQRLTRGNRDERSS